MDRRPFFTRFENSKIHVLAEISAMVEISAKFFFAEKNLYASFKSPVNISCIESKLMKLFENAIVPFIFQPHCRVTPIQKFKI